MGPTSEKLYDHYFDDLEDCTEYLKLPKKWVQNQENSGKWDYYVLDGQGLSRFLLEGNKQYLDISTADYVIRGDRFEPENEENIVSCFL